MANEKLIGAMNTVADTVEQSKHSVRDLFEELYAVLQHRDDTTEDFAAAASMAASALLLTSVQLQHPAVESLVRDHGYESGIYLTAVARQLMDDVLAEHEKGKEAKKHAS